MRNINWDLNKAAYKKTKRRKYGNFKGCVTLSSGKKRNVLDSMNEDSRNKLTLEFLFLAEEPFDLEDLDDYFINYKQ
jgi:hypothetical protein